MTLSLSSDHASTLVGPFVSLQSEKLMVTSLELHQLCVRAELDQSLYPIVSVSLRRARVCLTPFSTTAILSALRTSGDQSDATTPVITTKLTRRETVRDVYCGALAVTDRRQFVDPVEQVYFGFRIERRGWFAKDCQLIPGAVNTATRLTRRRPDLRARCNRRPALMQLAAIALH